ncbi:hypothetical protein EVAR_7602_1 [Eumeta japonica]|uniref:Uncharacterized protein n=1 Tax=Eumeta variegata TaxID=151549 RepID=A0A4C1TIZ5_EUMVA|nr:hypothetical protein EVAR_7602_1 [Eumeta japonica]
MNDSVKIRDMKVNVSGTYPRRMCKTMKTVLKISYRASVETKISSEKSYTIGRCTIFSTRQRLAATCPARRFTSGDTSVRRDARRPEEKTTPRQEYS